MSYCSYNNVRKCAHNEHCGLQYLYPNVNPAIFLALDNYKRE